MTLSPARQSGNLPIRSSIEFHNMFCVRFFSVAFFLTGLIHISFTVNFRCTWIASIWPPGWLSFFFFLCCFNYCSHTRALQSLTLISFRCSSLIAHTRISTSTDPLTQLHTHSESRDTIGHLMCKWPTVWPPRSALAFYFIWFWFWLCLLLFATCYYFASSLSIERKQSEAKRTAHAGCWWSNAQCCCLIKSRMREFYFALPQSRRRCRLSQSLPLPASSAGWVCMWMCVSATNANAHTHTH